MVLTPTIRLLETGKGDLKEIARRANSLLKREVLVGVPQEKRFRKNAKGPNNAMLAYIHDNGSPVKNIPRREFLRPGIQAGKAKIILRLGQGARLAVNGDIASIEKALTAAGLEAQKSVRAKITTGPFVKLKDATIAARRRKHKGRKSTNVSVTPLVDTGQLRNSINFVVVDKKK